MQIFHYSSSSKVVIKDEDHSTLKPTTSPALQNPVSPDPDPPLTCLGISSLFPPPAACSPFPPSSGSSSSKGFSASPLGALSSPSEASSSSSSSCSVHRV